MKMDSYFRISLMLSLVIHGAIILLALLIPYFLNHHYKLKSVKEKRFEVSLKNHLFLEPAETLISHVAVESLVPFPATAPSHIPPTVNQHPALILQSTPSDAGSRPIPPFVQRHYGDEFFELSSGEQNYILTNLQKIRKINDIVGNRLLQNKPQDNLENRDNNYVEFILHPDGTISDLFLRNERSDSLLDELTLETIELAHSQYPKPEQNTLIRIRVWILMK